MTAVFGSTCDSKPVVLGATGRVGTLLRRAVGPEAALWHSRTARPGFAHLSDVEDTAGLQSLLRDAPAVVCLLGAARRDDDDFQHHVRLARAVLDAAWTVGAGPVFLASSAAVYGTLVPRAEAGPIAPCTPYGAAKAAMEAMAADHPHQACCLRIGNVAGADAILGGWTPGMQLDHCAARGTPVRSYIGPVTLGRVLWTLMRRPKLPTVLNVASPGGVAMGDLLRAAHLPWRPRASSADTIWQAQMDTARLSGLMPLPPTTASCLVAEWQTLWAEAA